MFSKPSKDPLRSERSDPGQPGRKPMVASLIAENVTLNGDQASDGDVHLDGVVVGDLRVGRLTLGQNAMVEGAIEAESVEIRGRVTGSITARQIRLCATARVSGDMTHAELSIESGAHFEGRSLKFEALETAEPLALTASTVQEL